MNLTMTGATITFEDGTVIHMSLQEGFRLICSLMREGWEVRVPLNKREPEPPRDVS